MEFRRGNDIKCRRDRVIQRQSLNRTPQKGSREFSQHLDKKQGVTCTAAPVTSLNHELTNAKIKPDFLCISLALLTTYVGVHIPL